MFKERTHTKINMRPHYTRRALRTFGYVYSDYEYRTPAKSPENSVNDTNGFPVARPINIHTCTACTYIRVCVCIGIDVNMFSHSLLQNTKRRQTRERQTPLLLLRRRDCTYTCNYFPRLLWSSGSTTILPVRSSKRFCLQCNI